MFCTSTTVPTDLTARRRQTPPDALQPDTMGVVHCTEDSIGYPGVVSLDFGHQEADGFDP